jgi:DNA-binding cell septation regulator SpoVG
MINDQLDQRVAGLMGWDEKSRNGVDYWVAKDGVRQYRADGWSPSTNLAQAMGLWAEHRPVRHDLRVIQGDDNDWFVGVGGNKWRSITFTDLPRAITEAWCEAKEQEAVCEK